MRTVSRRFNFPGLPHLTEELTILQHSSQRKDLTYWKAKEGIPLTSMGVLAPGSANARPSTQPPIDVSGNFPAHVSAESP